MQRLYDAHRRPAGPIEFAGRGLPEIDHEIPKLEVFEARIGMHDDVRGHRIGEAEVIGGSDAVDQHAGLVAPRQRVDDGAGIWIGRLAGQAVGPRGSACWPRRIGLRATIAPMMPRRSLS